VSGRGSEIQRAGIGLPARCAISVGNAPGSAILVCKEMYFALESFLEAGDTSTI
jgi:hypothetical protein